MQENWFSASKHLTLCTFCRYRTDNITKKTFVNNIPLIFKNLQKFGRIQIKRIYRQVNSHFNFCLKHSRNDCAKMRNASTNIFFFFHNVLQAFYKSIELGIMRQRVKIELPRTYSVILILMGIFSFSNDLSKSPLS